jgi:hypothetical protein
MQVYHVGKEQNYSMLAKGKKRKRKTASKEDSTFAVPQNAEA